MPQIKPILWIFILFFIVFCLFLLMSLNYFEKKITYHCEGEGGNCGLFCFDLMKW